MFLSAWKIPAAKRVAWFCWWCRDYEAYKFSEEKLLELARANCVKVRPVRKMNTVLIENGDYDDADILPDVGEAELQEVAATD